MEKSINPIYADIDPESTLLFDRTIQNHLASTIHLTNTCPYSILYKLKLTASRSYIAQPPFGLLRPAHSMDVNVLITPIGYKSQSDIAQDKFLLTVVPCNQEPDDSSAADPVYMKTLWDITLPNSHPQIKKFTGKIQIDMETYLNLCSLNSDISPTGPIYVQARPESVISFGYMPKGIGTAQIELASVYHQTVLFKIKTTSPKKFIVKPYFGVLHPGQSITADIVMQFNEDELEGTRKIDKFLLSVIPYDEGLTSSRLTSYDFFHLEWDRMSVQPNVQIQGTHFLVKVVKSDIKSARTYNTESSKGI